MAPDSRPSFGELLDWLEGRLDEVAAARTGQRVADGDQATQRTVAWIQAFHQSTQRHRLEQPPPLLRQRLRQSFESHNQGAFAVERLVAEVSFDSRDESDLVGVRSDSHDLESYQLAYRASSPATEVDVLVDVTGDGRSSYRLDGQVFTREPSEPVWEAIVEQDAGTRRDVRGDELGSFSVQMVAPGPALLRLSNGRIEIDVPLLLPAP